MSKLWKKICSIAGISLILIVGIGITLYFTLKQEDPEPKKIEYKVSLEQDALNFIFITDLHMDTSAEDYTFIFEQLELIKKLATENELDFIAIGGDIYNGMVMTGKEDAYALLDSVSLFFKDLEIPVLILKGNHDDNSYCYYYERDSYYDRNPEYILSPEEFYNHTMKYYEKYISGYQDNYFYIDFPKKNTRVVCLNSTDYEYKLNEENKLIYSGRLDMGYTEKQLLWLKEKALNNPNINYLFLAHDYQSECNYRKSNNLKALFSLLKSLSNHTMYESENFTCNFMDYQSKVVAYLCGHLHADSVFYSNEIDCQVMRVGSAKIETEELSAKQAKKGLQRYMEREYTEEYYLFDVVSVKQTMVYTQRIGIGKDTWFVY